MSDQIGTFPAKVVVDRAGSVGRLDGIELPEGVDAFIFPAEISSGRLDAFFTHMSESTLRNFATDSAAGVSLLDSHNSRNLGFGQSMAGVFEVEGDVSRVVSEFYTIPGIRFGGSLTYESTDDFIKAIKSRLVRDVSVGFYGGDMICDICGNSFYDWMACSHWPGMEYAIGDRGETTVIATFSIEDAHLAEVSAVYDGATPGAMILRAQEMAEAGQLDQATARRLEVKYRIKLPGAVRSWPGVDINAAYPLGVSKTKKDRTMTEPKQVENNDPLRQAQDAALASIRAVLQEAKAPEGVEVEGVRWLVGELSKTQDEVTRLTTEVQRLQPLADDGTKYRTDLIDETIAEGVRAMGSNFSEETYRGMLASAPLDHIKQIKSNFAAQAKELLPGGRQMIDEDERQQEQGGLREVPHPCGGLFIAIANRRTHYGKPKKHSGV